VWNDSPGVTAFLGCRGADTGWLGGLVRSREGSAVVISRS
jgi:hypothetical protein